MAIEVQTRDSAGKVVGSVALDAEAFGEKVRPKLMHAASVMYHANQRQGSHCTKTRAEIAGSSKKLYRQKGTGRARAGNRKSGTRRGGGVIHGPKPRDYSYSMPRKQKQQALRSALLGKAKDGELHVVTELNLEKPSTKEFLKVLGALELEGSVLVATAGLKRNVYLSGRNVTGVKVLPAEELNAREVLLRKHLVIEQSAFEALNKAPEAVKRERKPKGTRKAKGEVKGADDAEASNEQEG